MKISMTYVLKIPFDDCLIWLKLNIHFIFRSYEQYSLIVCLYYGFGEMNYGLHGFDMSELSASQLLHDYTQRLHWNFS